MLDVRRRLCLSMLVTLPLAWACGGAVSTLHARGKPTGEGAAQLSISNSSGVAVHSLFMAKTSAVGAARNEGINPGSAEDDALWGDDLLQRGALAEGDTFDVGGVRPDRYDVLARDGDGREQLVKGLNLKPGGKYVLELADGWRLPR